MIIKTINEAEKIVEKSPNLHWDGWDIVFLDQDDYAEYLSIGFFDKQTRKWYKKTVFKYEDGGWNIPDSAIS